MCSKEILTDFSTFHGRYVVEVLHSYDLKFDDIYLQNDDLRTIMKDLAERDDVCFYNLACKIHEENATLTDTLLKSIFDETEFLAMQELLAKVGHRMVWLKVNFSSGKGRFACSNCSYYSQ